MSILHRARDVQLSLHRRGSFVEIVDDSTGERVGDPWVRYDEARAAYDTAVSNLRADLLEYGPVNEKEGNSQ